MPSYFFSHGAPNIVLEDNDYTRMLKNFRHLLPKPKAIVVFSAHWEAPEQTIGAAEKFDTIYDFGGFQPELYEITYPAKSNFSLAQYIQNLFTEHGISSSQDRKRGLDHGVWAILKLLYPEADIPVITLSVNQLLSAERQYAIGKALTILREQGILIIGSGGTVHNLRRLNWQAESADVWAVQFDTWIQSKLESWDTEALFRYRELAPYVEEAVPTSEHFIPLLLAMGTGNTARKAELLHRSYQYGNLSLSAWRFS